MKGRRILYVCHRSWPYMGGAERHFWEWAKRTSEEGNKVTIMTTDAWDIQRFHDPSARRIEPRSEYVEGIHVIRFPIRYAPRAIRPGLFSALRMIPGRCFPHAFAHPEILLPGYWLAMALGRKRYDLVHAGLFPHLFLMAPAIAYARRHRIPLAATPLAHLGEPFRPPGKQHDYLTDRHTSLLKKCGLVTCNTDIEREALIERGVPPNLLRVIGPGISPEKTAGGNAAHFRKKFKICGPIVLQISTQTHDKGSHHIVEAMKALWARGSNQLLRDFEYYLAGQPAEVFEKTFVLNYIDEQTKLDALAACDVFVMPSRADSFGIVFLEAWRYKKPVIGALAGGIPGVITHGEDGLLVPFGDTHMLIETLQEILQCPPLGRALGENGYRKLVKQHTWERSCSRLQEEYDRLLERHEAASNRD
ncbi:MAG: glycosyltransferase family 4 protein [Acidobacteriota bacterium]